MCYVQVIFENMLQNSVRRPQRYYFSTFAHIRMLILSIYVLVACINTIYKIWSFKYGIYEMYIKLNIFGLRSSISEVQNVLGTYYLAHFFILKAKKEIGL